MIPAFLARRNHGSFLNDTDAESRVGPVVVPRGEHNVSRANISPNALKVLYRLKSAGFDAFLVGERFMTRPDPGAALAELLAEARA